MNPYELLNIPVTATQDEIRTAYRMLARRWHPDRFMAGPERDWANEKMAEINAAYRACLSGITAPTLAREAEADALEQVKKHVAAGEYITARRLLMGFSTRSAEWNYLFGTVLSKTGDREKALIYFTVAAHQEPSCEKYVRASSDAAPRKRPSIFARKKRP